MLTIEARNRHSTGAPARPDLGNGDITVDAKPDEERAEEPCPFHLRRMGTVSSSMLTIQSMWLVVPMGGQLRKTQVNNSSQQSPNQAFPSYRSFGIFPKNRSIVVCPLAGRFVSAGRCTIRLRGSYGGSMVAKRSLSSLTLESQLFWLICMFPKPCSPAAA